MERILERTLNVIALVLCAISLAKAWTDVSTTWDVWYYHMPFAARMWGIVSEDYFQFFELNEIRYHSFPQLAEFLQGALWKVTNHPQATNLLSWGSLGALSYGIARLSGLSFGCVYLALYAIPSVEAHATSSYIDLPANACVTAFLLGIWILREKQELVTRTRLIFLLIPAFCAANMKFQLNPVILLGLLFLLWTLRKNTFARLVVPFSMPLIFATALRNLIVFKNPLYPVQFSVLGKELPYAEPSYHAYPDALAFVPQPVRWLFSVFEWGLRPYSDPARWRVDQWAESGSSACRMGGFFGVYVIFLVFLFFLLLRFAPIKNNSSAKRSAFAFLGLSLFTSLMPQSHEARYYMHWMLTLVGLVCLLIPTANPKIRIAFKAALPLFVGFVLMVNRGAYLIPDGEDLQTVAGARLHQKWTSALRSPGKEKNESKSISNPVVYCLSHEPWSMLYSYPIQVQLRPSSESIVPYQVKAYEDVSECPLSSIHFVKF